MEAAFILAGLTATAFVAGTFNLQISYARLGVPAEAIPHVFEDRILASASVFSVALQGFFVAWIGNAVGREFGPRPSTPPALAGVAFPPDDLRASRRGFTIPGLLALGTGYAVAHAAIVRGLTTVDAMCVVFVSLPFVLVFAALHAAVSEPLHGPRTKYEAWVRVVFFAPILIWTTWIGGTTPILVGIVGGLVVEAAVQIIRRLQPPEPSRTRARANFWARVSGGINVASRAFLLVTASLLLILAGIFSGQAEGDRRAAGCTAVQRVEFHEDPPGLNATQQYWLVLQAGGNYYLRETDALAGDRTIYVVPSTLTGVTLHGRTPLKDC